MSERGQAVQAEGEHERAVQRLQEAVALHRRLRDENKATKDTPQGLAVDASMRVAEDQVQARERWLKSVDDHNY